MIRLSIRRKIMGIAVALIVLMAITSVMTVVLVMQVGTRIEELTYSYMPAYGDLARANIRSLERALAIRRIIVDDQYFLHHSEIRNVSDQIRLDK